MKSVPTPRDARGRTTRLPPALAANVWKPGQSGNSTGRGGEYQRCLMLCREASYDAAKEIIRLSKESEDERIVYMCATWIVERAWGKAKEFDPLKERAPIKFNIADYSPEQLAIIEQAMEFMKQVRDRKLAEGGE